MPAGTYYNNDKACNRESGNTNLGWRTLGADKTFTRTAQRSTATTPRVCI
ncbi:hypothetical protein H1235_05210 [Pseudoxanthomonas sp. NC8]|nr:hypothetical protein H1235_05210 [Pseudoxanthomonas sp. NC8]